MKLVELLAKEVSEWPEEATHASQDYDREIRFYDADEDPLSLLDFFVGEHADDACDEITFAGGGVRVSKAQWQAERDRQKGGEWKRHRGGKMPVEKGARIEVKHRYGEVYQDEAGGGYSRDWSHTGAAGDIMKYRVISQPQAEEVEVKDTTIGTLSYKVEIDTSSATQAIDELAAKWDKVDGPLRWRDCVNELDAYIEEFTREREALINRLAEEGFALIPAMTAVMGVADVDMGDWRNWEIGDHLEIFDEKEGHKFKMGQIVKVTGFDGSDEGLPVKASSLNDDEWWFVNNLEAKFIRRP